MKTRSGNFVLPGDILGVTEEFLPAEGAYEEDGKIKSLVAGTVSVDMKNKKISIKPRTKQPTIMRKGDIVLGQISDVRGQRALLRIEGIKNNKRSTPLNFSGGIHISQAQKGYVSKLSDEFRIGDIIEARVTKVLGVDNVDLTTAEKELGVVKAMCTNCRHYMKKMNKNEAICPNCGRKERRKMSSHYEG